MLAIPAIDVLDGRVVRLLRGSYDSVTVYADDPIPIVERYVGAGAKRIHLVDLVGARTGAVSIDLVSSVAPLVPDLQVGGGIRSVDTARAVLEAGASRIVVGSLAIHDPEQLARLVEALGADRVVVAVDVADGRARGQGWTDRGISTPTAVESAVWAGAESLLVTGIDRDGTLRGVDLQLLGDVRSLAPGQEIIASGGASSLDDLGAAAAAGADAAVVGRALLEGLIDIDELLARFG